MKERNGQVQLSKLIFTHNWEDPAVDEKALRIQPGDTVFTITSGGCNSLGFLRLKPSQLFCVDINPAQTWLMELKKAAYLHLSDTELPMFFGLRPGSNRAKLYSKLRSDLSHDAREFFDKHPGLVKKGIIMNGRYERFVKIAARFIRLLQGGARVRRLYKLNTVEEQQSFYKEQWNNRRWRWIFTTMFNKKRLAKKGLNADYFHFDDGSRSFSESFQKRAAHAISDLPVKSNYFLSLYLFGKYQDNDNIPEYLRPKNFEAIREKINSVNPVTADSKYWLEQQPANLFDAMALSNICELMDEKDTHKLFSEVIRTAKPGARIVFRNLMIPREVPEDLRKNIVKDEPLSKELQYNDRSFVYGKVAAYTIVK
jgi:S-adenosylmethionine-diacylglycerol 3-amino-3-carboxypropyl transferase